MVFGGEEEDRTPDLCIANAALSQLSYSPTVCSVRNYRTGIATVQAPYVQTTMALVFIVLCSLKQ